jgi:hypothetical protein
MFWLESSSTAMNIVYVLKGRGNAPNLLGIVAGDAA